MNTYFSTDWHGEFEKATKALKLAGFDLSEDKLIYGGDYSDRGPDSFLCMELLLSIKNLIYIKGNHCECILDMFKKNYVSLWKHGQKQTLISYVNNSDKYKESDYNDYVNEKLSGVVSHIPKDLAPKSHIDLLENSLYYYIDNKNRLFLHAGYILNIPLEDQLNIVTWDRNYVKAFNNVFNFADPNYTEVYLGHTPVQYFNEATDKIMNKNNIYLCDTGAGKIKEAPVSIINIDTKETFYGY